MYAFLLLPALALAASAGVVSPAATQAPRIILPAAPFGQSGARGIVLSVPPATLTVAPAPSLIVPKALVIAAPAPRIIIAGRPLTQAEANPEKLPSSGELKKLAESLSPARDAADPAEANAEHALDTAFDGTLAPEAAAWGGLSKEFSRGPLAPALPIVDSGARSLIARLLPEVYRRVPALARYDRGERPSTGHLWTPKTGHIIEINPVRPNSDGNVPSAFGGAREPLIQQKISHLMEFAHEYFHVLFDSALRRKENHPMTSVYSAMTEGFAVSGEQILADKMLGRAPMLGLGPRDAMDIAGIINGRHRWLDIEDNHYTEGMLSWRKSYQEGGTKGMLAFLASLSARRMIAIPRSDSAYQLILGNHQLLSAYLGSDRDTAEGRGAEAFARAAKGETLTVTQTREAAAIVERAGPDGWKRLFDRTVLSDKRLAEPKAEEPANWWEKKAAPMASVEPVFAMARLSPAAGAAVASHLVALISEPGGASRLFEKAGPNEKLTAVIAGAETLPWDEADRKVWNDGLTRWLIGTN